MTPRHKTNTCREPFLGEFIFLRYYMGLYLHSREHRKNCLRSSFPNLLGLFFWHNGLFSRIFIFGPPDFFFFGFSRRSFSPHFCGKKWPEKSSRKIPGKILQNLYNKNPRHISAERPGQNTLQDFGGNSLRCEYMPRLYSHPRDHRSNYLCIGFVRGFEKGLAGGGWRPRAPKIQQKNVPRIVFSYS